MTVSIQLTEPAQLMERSVQRLLLKFFAPIKKRPLGFLKVSLFYGGFGNLMRNHSSWARALLIHLKLAFQKEVKCEIKCIKKDSFIQLGKMV
ncbi:MAG: hypothetical protein CMK59_05075 [Proteobacteria bacterium]|nr:hypothetical protein [Pseudomonadota bacterium]